MNLQLYRDHMTTELNSLPDLRSQEIESYVVTTAILARRIDDRLGAPLTRMNNMRRTINMLIHHSVIQPAHEDHEDTCPVSMAIAPRYVRSDKQPKGDDDGLLVIDLEYYFRAMRTLADDDLFVLQHLVKTLVTRSERCDRASVHSMDLRMTGETFGDTLLVIRRVQDQLPLRSSFNRLLREQLNVVGAPEVKGLFVHVASKPDTVIPLTSFARTCLDAVK